MNSSKMLWWVVAGLLFLVVYMIVEHFMQIEDKPSISKARTISTKLPAEEKQKVIEVVTKDTTEQKTIKESELKKPLETQKPSKIDYSFYYGLSKTEVIVKAAPISVKLIKPYYIQAGTFYSLQAAKRERKRLIKLGFKLNISILKGKSRTFYRLRLGPFKDRLVMNSVRNSLLDARVDVLIIKG